ncbi:MAG: tetratricopeptide repeat protein [Deltaproteobacteria bacterium]|nr:tetratricopeptide repeat protein [Deltaproteobacteria bacterium]
MSATRVLVFLFTVSIASGICTPKSTAAPQTDGARAQELAQTGVNLFKEGKYQEALALFLASYHREKIAEVAWNIGRCYEEMGELEKALEYFAQFQSVADDLAKKATAYAKIEELRKRIDASKNKPPAKKQDHGELVVTAEGDPGTDVAVVVDGVEMHRGALPARLLVEPGIHKVRITGVVGYLPIADNVRVERDGISVVTMKPAPTQTASPPGSDGAEPRMAAVGADPRYGDPFLMPTSRTGFMFGMELSPVFKRGPGSATALCGPNVICDPGRVRRPNETWAGFSGQIGMGKRASLTLAVGRRSRVPWNRIHDPFQKAGMELKFRTSVGPKSWSSFVLDMDWAHGYRLVSTYENQVFPAFTTSTSGASPVRSSHALALTLGEAFGFSIADLATIEFYIGFAYAVPDVTWDYGWGKLAYIHIPVASRVSFQVAPGAHVGIEARFPISLGPLGNLSSSVNADMALTYRQVIDHVIVGWAVFSAVNHLDAYGREIMGLILTAEYAF